MSKVMEYKGYQGSVDFSLEDRVLHGKILHINDLVTFEAESLAALEEAFHEAVEDYLDDYSEFCEEEGYNPSVHNRRNNMTRNLGKFVVSSDTLFNMLEQGMSWPASLRALAKTPNYANGTFEVLAEYAQFAHVPEGDEIPFYYVEVTKDPENGEWHFHFDREDEPVFRKERNFNNRFETEQEILGLWGMFDMIHLIVWRIDHNESIDAVSNAWIGLISFLTVQLDVMEKYGEGSLMPKSRFAEVRKLIDQLDHQFSWYYDGPTSENTTAVLHLLRVRKEAEELMESIFNEFEESIN